MGPLRYIVHMWVILSLTAQLTESTPEDSGRCAYNGVRKPKPSSNKEPFVFCKRWQSRSCCTSDTVKLIKSDGQVKLDGTKWDLCGPLSKECEMRFKFETCFYECEPNLGSWIIKRKKSKMERFKGLPICASSCDIWYDKCKNDLTCAKSWPRDMKWSRRGNQCKSGAKCETYEKVYGSGKALCENIWGSTFKYTPDDQACLKFHIDGSIKTNNKI